MNKKRHSLIKWCPLNASDLSVLKKSRIKSEITHLHALMTIHNYVNIILANYRPLVSSHVYSPNKIDHVVKIFSICVPKLLRLINHFCRNKRELNLRFLLKNGEMNAFFSSSIVKSVGKTKKFKKQICSNYGVVKNYFIIKKHKRQ
jgi:hypothetical protein